MNLKPIGDKVIVEIMKSKEKTETGIYLPDTAQEKPQEGKIVAVGSGKVLPSGKSASLDVKVGDEIIFAKYTGNEIKLDGRDYLIVNNDEILAVIDKK